MAKTYTIKVSSDEAWTILDALEKAENIYQEYADECPWINEEDSELYREEAKVCEDVREKIHAMIKG